MVKLTPKQERFALNIFKGLSQRQAYLDAGYSPRQADNTLDQHAMELAKNTLIVVRLEELRLKAETASIATVEEKEKVLTKIIRGELKNVEVTDSPDGRTTKVKTIDPTNAVMAHNKMKGIGSDVTINIVNNYNFVIERMVAAFQEVNEIEDKQERLSLFAQRADAIIDQVATKVKEG